MKIRVVFMSFYAIKATAPDTDREVEQNGGLMVLLFTRQVYRVQVVWDNRS